VLDPSRSLILIIDDDRELNGLLSQFLTRFGHEVIAASRPDEGLALLRERKPSIVVLDVMLPDRDGFEVCREIRRESQVPILMLTARGETNDRIHGLELGADDYLPKPYDPRELAARIQSVLRRAPRERAPEAIEKIEDLAIDWTKGTAQVNGQDVGLTGAEFEILALLVRKAGETVSRDQIAQTVRGSAWDAVDRSIDVLVSRLRHKLGDSSRQPKYLKTMWGDGYRFVARRGPPK